MVHSYDACLPYNYNNCQKNVILKFISLNNTIIIIGIVFSNKF